MPTFFLVETDDSPDAVVPTRICRITRTGDPLFSLPEVMSFFETATNGDVFQLRHTEYIFALGTLTVASWLR
jgi:hypothetical protein